MTASVCRKKGKKTKNRHAGGHAPSGKRSFTNDTHKRKPAVSRGKASCGAGFRLKRGNRGKKQNKALPQ